MEFTAERLRPESHLPYYVQLKHILKAQIRQCAAHAPLPSESELQKQFDVSRPVVRQALTELAFEGLVYRRRGKGTYVAPPKVMEGQVQHLASVKEELVNQGYEPVTVVLQQELISADGSLAEQLSVVPGAILVALRRLRLINGEPFMVASSLLPHELCPGLESIDLVTRSLYQVLSAEYGLAIARGTRTLESIAAVGRVAEELRVPVGQPLMHIELTSYDPYGRTIEASESYHRGDRAKFHFELKHES